MKNIYLVIFISIISLEIVYAQQDKGGSTIGLYELNYFNPSFLLTKKTNPDGTLTYGPDGVLQSKIIDSLTLIINSSNPCPNDYTLSYLYEYGLKAPDTTDTKLLLSALELDSLNIDANYFLGRVHYMRFINSTTEKDKQIEAQKAALCFTNVISSEQQFLWKTIACHLLKQLDFYLNREPEGCKCEGYNSYFKDSDFYTLSGNLYEDETSNVLTQLEQAYSFMGRCERTLSNLDELPLHQISNDSSSIMRVTFIQSKWNSPLSITLRLDERNAAEIKINLKLHDYTRPILSRENPLAYAFESEMHLSKQESELMVKQIKALNFSKKPMLLPDYWPVISWDGRLPSSFTMPLVWDIMQDDTPEKEKDSLRKELKYIEDTYAFYSDKIGLELDNCYVLFELSKNNQCSFTCRWSFAEDQDLKVFLNELLRYCYFPRELVQISMLEWYEKK